MKKQNEKTNPVKMDSNADDIDSGQLSISNTINDKKPKSTSKNEIQIYIQQLTQMAKHGFLIYRNQMDKKKLEQGKIVPKEQSLNRNKLAENELKTEKIGIIQTKQYMGKTILK